MMNYRFCTETGPQCTMFTISEEFYAENTAVKSQAHAQVCQNNRSKGRHTPARFFILQIKANKSFYSRKHC